MVNSNALGRRTCETRNEKILGDLGVIVDVKGLGVTGEDGERKGLAVGDDRVLILVVDDGAEFENPI